MESKRKEEGKGKRKRIKLNFKLKGNWKKHTDALKEIKPKFILEDMNFESDKETNLFI